jgi:predicted RND superfamily exporter protein
MTSLTTAAGLLSFSYAKLSAIAEMGLFAAAGVLLAVFYTIIMLPALLALVPIKRTGSAEKRSHLMDRVLLAFADFSTARPAPILMVTAMIFIFSLFYITRLEFSHNDVEYFPDDNRVKTDLIKIDRELKGALALEVIIDTGRENGVYDPEVMNRIDALAGEIEKIHRTDLFVGKVISIVDILKETNQALNANHPDHYAIPQNRDAIAQQLLLFENSGSEDLEKIVDSQFQKTRFTIKTPWVDAMIFEDFIEEIQGLFNETFKESADITISGLIALMARTIPATLQSMARSYVIAFVVIAVMMVVLVGSLKVGLLSMIPNLLPILLVMGLIGFSGLPLSINTLMIGSIAMGLVVDDTIHFMYNFRRYFMKTNDARRAVRETLLSTGRALLITTLILSAGFFCIMFGTLKNFLHFGFFTGLTIILALLADFLVAPALLVFMIEKNKISINKHPADLTPSP